MSSGEKDSLLRKGIHDALESALPDEKANTSAAKLRDEFIRYGGDFLKAVPLFVPSVGKKVTFLTYGASALFHGLDQVKANDDLSTQLTDFALGATKGVAIKGSFDALARVDFTRVNKLAETGLVPSALSGKPLELSAKAFSFGISSRYIDASLTRETYLDTEGKFDLTRGMSQAFSQSFNRSALATDLIVFGGAAAALKGVNIATRGLLDRSVLAQTMATGGSFGLGSGTVAEVQRQNALSSPYDFKDIALRGFLEAGVNTLAAGPGGLRARQLSQRTALSNSELQQRSTPVTDHTQGTAFGSIPSRTGFEHLRSTHLQTAREISSIPMFREIIPTDLNRGSALQHANEAPINTANSLPIAKIDSKAGLDKSIANNLLQIQTLTEIGKHNNPAEGALHQATKFVTGSGKEFWQLQDGRIYYEAPSAQTTVPQVWVPFGSVRQLSGELVPVVSAKSSATKDATQTDGSAATKQADGKQITGHPPETPQQPSIMFTLNESLGIMESAAGRPRTQTIASSLSVGNAEKLSGKQFKQIDELGQSLPKFEADWQSSTRLLHTAQGKPYESSSITLKITFDTTSGAKSESGAKHQSVTIPTRTYRFMSEREAAQMNDLQHKVKNGEAKEAELEAFTKSVWDKAPRIRVPEDYAQKLDALREIRKTATLESNLLPELSEQINAARRQLFTSPYRDRFLPEHTRQFIDTLPNPELVKEIMLLDSPPTHFGGASNTKADASSSRIRYFDTTLSVGSEFRLITNHEWSHLLQYKNPTFVDAADAANLIGKRFVSRQYELKNASENWAVNLGEMFLNPSPDKFITVAHRAPLKAAVFARALEKNPSTETHDAATVNKRIEYVRQNLLPEVKKQLDDAVKKSSELTVLAATKVVNALEGFAKPEEIINLSEVKTRTGKDATPEQQTREYLNRVILRTEILRVWDPPAFQRREARYNEQIARVAKINSEHLSTGTKEQRTALLNFADAMRQSPDLAPFFQRMYKLADFEKAAKDATQPENAVRALKTITEFYATTQSGYESTRRLASHAGPAQLKAIEYLISVPGTDWLAKSYSVIEKVVTENPNANISSEITSLLKDKMVEVPANTLAVNKSSINYLMQLQMLDHIYKLNPALRDAAPDNTQLLARLKDDMKQKLVQHFSGRQTQNQFQTMSTLRGLLDSQSASMIELNRSLISVPTLTTVIRAEGKSARPALDILSTLHMERAVPLIEELAHGRPFLRTDAMEILLNQNDLGSVNSGAKAVAAFARRMDTGSRTQLIHSLMEPITNALELGVNNQSQLLILKARIAAAESLIRPLPAADRDQFMNHLQTEIDKFNRKRRGLGN